MDRQEMIKKYPIGSKLVGRYLGHKQSSSEMICKVVGYSAFRTSILVYNPEIIGHIGTGRCVDQIGSRISGEKIKDLYGDHCWYVKYEDLRGNQ